MEELSHFMLLLSATSVLVTADSSTSHYLGCLHESQCEKVFNGEYCCPTGTCCHFFERDSSKFMSVCKRIRPGQTWYCQDQDKVLLNGKDLIDRRFLLEYPPNKGVVCLSEQSGHKVCFGGTDSEEEQFKAQGIEMNFIEYRRALTSWWPGYVVKSDIKDMDHNKLENYLFFVILRLSKQERRKKEGHSGY